MQVGDVGTTISIDVGEDISAATAVKIHYKKPDGTVGNWTASVADDDQSVEYNTQASDINVVGLWQFQAHITLPTWNGYSTIVKQQVNEALV